MVPAAPQSAPHSGPSVQPDQADSSDPSSDDTVPISEAPKAMKAAHRSPAPANAPSALAGGAGTSALRYACRHPAQPGRRECDSILVARALSVCKERTLLRVRSAGRVWSGAGGEGEWEGRHRRGRRRVRLSDASSDLAVYRKSMGLRACSVSNRCLKVVNQLGQTMPLPKPNADPTDDWRAEEAVDLQMVSALCPNCRIVLVQANSNKDADLAAGVNAAAALGAAAISNSYSGSEGNAADAAYARAGRAIISSGGNDGAAGKQPCSYSAVVCVGGTTLQTGLWASLDRTRVAQSSQAQPCRRSPIPRPESRFTNPPEADGSRPAAPALRRRSSPALFALEPSSVRANAPAWLGRHGGARARAATKMGGM